MSAALTPTPAQRATFQHLYWDVFWFGVLQGSAIAFISVYAARLGAGAFQISLLSSGPAVINLLASLPAGHWLAGRSAVRVTFLTSLWQRAGYGLLILLPWIFSGAQAAWAVPIIIIAMAVPGTTLAIAFNAMFADVVPPEWRAHVVGRRNALLAISSTVTSLACGQLLDRLDFPGNYQGVFLLGTVGAALSSIYLGRLRAPATLPQRVGRLLDDNARPGAMPRLGDAVRSSVGLRFLTRAGGTALLRLDLVRGPFGPLLGAYLVFYIFQYLSIPLMPLFWVNDLKLSDGVISIGNAIFYGTMLAASLGLPRLTARLGHHRVLVVGALLYGLYPALNALAQEAGLFYLASFIGGAVWGVANGGLVNRLMERVPEDDRPAHMALHNLALNFGILLGSLLGPALGEGFDLRTAILISAALRVVGGLLLARWA
ncbi:MAG: MFS transporter [Anaerolineales bacterium]|nr:MFS transporter [Anaerolineales bacterium]